MRFQILSFLFVTNIFCSWAQEPTFKEVVHRLQTYIPDIEVLSSDKGIIAVSPSYQGRVFTSSAKGLDGKSYGWINWKIFDEGNSATQMTYLGGESRLWFAPEFGKYSIFHKPGDALTPKAMRPPKGLEQTLFQLVEKDSTHITTKGTLEILNFQNTLFNLEVDRSINLLSQEDIEHDLNITLDSIDYVAFNAFTSITNIGEDWDLEKGLIGIWELGCQLTSKDNTVMIPIKEGETKVTSYFGGLPKDRIQIKEGTVYFKADAAYLNKIGIPPSVTKNVMGSYSPSMNLLNIVTFKLEKGEYYMSSVPRGVTNPYQGDVINIFNGEVIPEENHNWPFFEFESSSQAKVLKNGETLSHYQTTYHFEGDFKLLNKIAKKVLGVDLKAIPDFE